MPQTGLYLHIPFCQTKCGYCDFFSIPGASTSFPAVLPAIVQELETKLARFDGRIDTIFCGGGTPTHLAMPDFEKLFTVLGGIAHEHRVGEFTVEANPATVDAAKARFLRDAGVNRVSMGAQSFVPSELLFLERIHRVADVAESVRIVRHSGINRINLDLIFGIPGQTIESWMFSVGSALALEVDHLACYGLTYEAGTKLTGQLHRKRFQPCDEELEAALYETTVTALAEAGLRQYEISNYARPGHECLHNVGYWRNQPYLGVGPSAVSYYNGRRSRNVPDLGSYVKAIRATGDATLESEVVTGRQLAAETVMLQLRMNRGIDPREFATICGLDPRDTYQRQIHELTETGLLETTENAIRLTHRGRLVADAVIAEFMD